MDKTWAEYKSIGLICREYGLCRKAALKVAEQAGALFEFGNAYRIKTDVFDSYIKSSQVNSLEEHKQQKKKGKV